MERERRAFAELAARAERPVAITGAGVSAESGVPTFRGADGLWRRRRPEELATPEAFRRDPTLVWTWYDWRRSLVARAEPNPAHRWLAGYERTKPAFLLVTQNVDGLHAEAGSRNVVEIHGSLWRTRCTSCGEQRTDRRVPVPIPPRCERCGEVVRPDVVWFGEALDAGHLQRAARALRKADLLMVLGTSGVVYPVAGFPDLAPNARLAEVNPDPTPLTARSELSVRAPAGAFLAPLTDARPRAPKEGPP